tara:strand:+ start:1118 stop:1741 length:624 start_codon:yes stop_codon:yes gene_type:complete
MLTNIVKISNVTNLSDARYCAGMGVEMLGFSMDEMGAHYITPKKFGEISSWISGVKMVIETFETDVDSLLSKLTEYQVDYIEINDSGIIQELKSKSDLPVILRIDVDIYNTDDLESIVNRNGLDIAYFLLDSNSGASLNVEWLELIKQLGQDYKLLIGFGIEDATSVKDLDIENPNIGIGLKGSDEIRPGFKDFGSMMDILEELEDM